VQRDEGERKNEKEETRIDESGYRRWEPGIRTEVNVERGSGVIASKLFDSQLIFRRILCLIGGSSFSTSLRASSVHSM